MSDKLNSSLDDILKSTRSSTRRGRGNRRNAPGRRNADAPVGGVQKPAAKSKPTKATPAAPAVAVGGETKIMISNLPLDVEEAQLKEYFTTAAGVGRPKRIIIQYGANGKSLGSATVIFSKAEQANKAAQVLSDVKIDGRPIRVEVLVNAAAVAAQAAPSLADRITQPKKDKPKPVTAAKGGADTRQGQGRGRGRGRGRGGRAGREGNRKKTVAELDAEMEDYFPNENGDAMVTAAATGDDANMVDEML